MMSTSLPSSCTQAQVYSVLLACLNSDAAERALGEETLSHLAQTSTDFPLFLANIALNNNNGGIQQLSFAPRQLAMLSLKSYIDSHWCPHSTKYSGPEPPEHIKAAVRLAVLPGLADALSKIRVATAFVISKIAHFDWPESWPNLLDSLLFNLKQQSPIHVHGAMRVLIDFVGNDMTEQHFPMVAPVIIPELFRIFTSRQIYEPRVRARAVFIIREFIKTLYTVKDTHPQVSTTYVQPILAQWLPAFQESLQVSSSLSSSAIASSNGDNSYYYGVGEIPVKIEIVLTLIKTHKFFRESLSSNLTTLLETVWGNLLGNRGNYIQNIVNYSSLGGGGDQEDHEDIDSDGHVLNIDNLTSILFDFVGEVCMEKAVKKMFGVMYNTTRGGGGGGGIGASLATGRKNRSSGGGGGSGDATHSNPPSPHLVGLCETFLSYMQISEKQIDAWNENVGELISEEEEMTVSFSLRKKAVDTFMDICQDFGTDILKAANVAVANILTEANKQRAAGNRYWWKLHEVALLLLGHLSGEIIEAVDACKLDQRFFDLSGLFQNVVLEDAKLGDLPFLQGRAFWFASKYAEILPSGIIQQFVGAAVNSLQDGHSIIVRAFAVKALRSFSEFCKKEDIEPFSGPMIQGLANLLATGSQASTSSSSSSIHLSESLAGLLLDTLVFAVKLNDQIVAQYEPILTPLLLCVWGNYAADMYIVESLKDLFGSISKNAFIYSEFEKRILSALSPLFEQGLAVAISEETVDSPLPFPSIMFAGTEVHADLVSGMTWAAMEIMSIMLKNTTNLSPLYIQYIFPNVIRILNVSKSNSVLQCGQEFLTVLLQKDFSAVASWVDASISKTGLDYVIGFLAKLLQPDEQESGALFVGELITKLILKGGNQLQPVLPDLLKAVAIRLNSAKSPSFIQTLTLVFAQLIAKEQFDINIIISFLQGLPLKDDAQHQQQQLYGNGLEMLINTWCDNHSSFVGFYAVKVSSVALAKLFAMNDARLQAIMVKGDIVVSQNDRIVTRSRSKKMPDQFTIIPFPAKVVKLLLSDYLQSMDQAATLGGGGGGGLGGLSMSMDENTTGGGSDFEDYEDEDDDDEWENNSREVESDELIADLAVRFSADELDDNEEDDPDIQSDPIYQTNMKTYIGCFFKSCVANNFNNFMEIGATSLNPMEKENLQSLLL